jgi:hypothetical protein
VMWPIAHAASTLLHSAGVLAASLLALEALLLLLVLLLLSPHAEQGLRAWW